MENINDLYLELSAAYDHFNKELFANVLQECVLTLTRQSRAYGFFAPNAFRSREGERAPEIALNPENFLTREPIEIYSTLVHEMCHYYQDAHGKPSRSGYHNKEFARIMQSVGLQCSSTGQPGGKDTGQNMTHYVIAGGLFEESFLRFNQVRIAQWGALPELKEQRRSQNKVKYECPECGQKAWAKPGAELLCGACSGSGNEETGATWVYMAADSLL